MNSFNFVTLEALVQNIWSGEGQGSNMSMIGEWLKLCGLFNMC